MSGWCEAASTPRVSRNATYWSRHRDGFHQSFEWVATTATRNTPIIPRDLEGRSMNTGFRGLRQVEIVTVQRDERIHWEAPTEGTAHGTTRLGLNLGWDRVGRAHKGVPREYSKGLSGVPGFPATHEHYGEETCVFKALLGYLGALSGFWRFFPAAPDFSEGSGALRDRDY